MILAKRPRSDTVCEQFRSSNEISRKYSVWVHLTDTSKLAVATPCALVPQVPSLPLSTRSPCVSSRGSPPGESRQYPLRRTGLQNGQSRVPYNRLLKLIFGYCSTSGLRRVSYMGWPRVGPDARGMVHSRSKARSHHPFAAHIRSEEGEGALWILWQA